MASSAGLIRAPGMVAAHLFSAGQAMADQAVGQAGGSMGDILSYTRLNINRQGLQNGRRLMAGSTGFVGAPGVVARKRLRSGIPMADHAIFQLGGGVGYCFG